jgi:hypothetical protein
MVNADFASVEPPGSDGFDSHSGNFFARLGEIGDLGTLTQTVIDVAGQNYTLAMFLGSDGGTPNAFRVDWNGTTLYDQTNLGDTRGNTDQYNLLSFNVVGTGSDTLTLYERNDPGYLALDDVSLNSANAVPEPSTLVMSSILIGMFGVVGLRKRLSKSAA